uniref:Sperm surface protein Sp17 n=1 Tax=Terrapene triunguis TaxID=2587831 RepID=A0A674IZG3_9SAUR
MSIPFSNTHHRIPPGFANLLEGLAREVLREQPEDIPAFAANYFEELLDKREKTKFDPAEWGAKLDDRFYNNKAFEVGWAGIHVYHSSQFSVICKLAEGAVHAILQIVNEDIEQNRPQDRPLGHSARYRLPLIAIH